MKLLKYLIFLLAAAPLASRGQAPFFKTYGKVPQDYFYSMHKTFDGGYILSGLSNSFGGSNYLFLTRTDANGDTLWMRAFVTSNSISGASVVQCADSGFAVCGYSGYAKLDKNGNLLWNYQYTGTSFYSVRETPDKGLIIAGTFGQSGASNGMDVYILKTDSNGVKQWSRKYGGPGDDYATCIRVTSDSGYVLAGNTNSFGAGSWDIYVIKMNSLGDTLWTRTYGGALADGGISNTRQTIEQTFDAGYAIGGYSASFATAGGYDAYLVKTDAAGGLSWSKMYGGFLNEIIHDVKQCADSGYVLVGYTMSSGGGGADMFLVRTDADGDTLFTRCYGGLLNDYAQQVVTMADKGFVVCGYSNNYGSGNNDAVLLRLDSLGMAACHQNSTGTFISTPSTATAATVTGKIFLTLNVTLASPVMKTGGNITDACSVNGIEDVGRKFFTVFPNPSSGAFAILTAEGAYRVLVKDVLGKTRYEKWQAAMSGRMEVDLRNAEPGIYFIELYAGKTISVHKILIIN